MDNSRYLYRAKGKTNHKWHTGFLISVKDDICFIQKNENLWICDSKTLCQSTGLKEFDNKDNSGNIIFEKDIVQFENGQNDRKYTYLIWWNNEISALTAVPIEKISYNRRDYYDKQIVVSKLFNYETFAEMILNAYGDFSYAKILGNIIDNPELFNIKEDTKNL